MLPHLLFEALKVAPLDTLLWRQAADALEELGEIEWAKVFRARAGAIDARPRADYFPAVDHPEGDRWAMKKDWHVSVIAYLTTNPNWGKAGLIHYNSANYHSFQLDLRNAKTNDQ